MQIPAIISEIDGYLSCLRQARELLLEGKTKTLQKHRKEKTAIKQANPAAVARKRPSNGNRSKSNRSILDPKKLARRINNIAAGPNKVVATSAPAEQPALMNPGQTIPQSVVIQRVPARRRAFSDRTAPRRTAKRASGSKPDAIKPAIALAGSVNTKIVVVPAEQLQQERKNVAEPEIRKRPLSVSGLTGRRAFEALFKDETNPSKAPAQ